MSLGGEKWLSVSVYEEMGFWEGWEGPCELVVLIGPLAPGHCDNIKGQIYIKRCWETLTYVGK